MRDVKVRQKEAVDSKDSSAGGSGMLVLACLVSYLSSQLHVQ